MCHTIYLTKCSLRGTRSNGKPRTPYSTTTAILSLLLFYGYRIFIYKDGKLRLSHPFPFAPLHTTLLHLYLINTMKQYYPIILLDIHYRDYSTVTPTTTVKRSLSELLFTSVYTLPTIVLLNLYLMFFSTIIIIVSLGLILLERRSLFFFSHLGYKLSQVLRWAKHVYLCAKLFYCAPHNLWIV